jgi:hypothetical protein
VSPQRADLVLAADVPDVELGVLVGDGLDVEADRGDGGDVLVELELVEDGCAGVSGRRHTAQRVSYWSFLRRPGPASRVASPWIRRSCSSSSILKPPSCLFGAEQSQWQSEAVYVSRCGRGGRQVHGTLWC